MADSASAITAEEFSACDPDAVIAPAAERTCNAYAKLLEAHAAELEAAKDPRGPAARLLALATSIFLDHGDPDEGLGPIHIVRSISREQAAEFERLAATLVDPELRARVADIAWLAARLPGAARVAVDAYLAAAERLHNPSHWVGEQVRLARALSIGCRLGRSHDTFTNARNAIVSRLASLGDDDPLYLTARLVELLLEVREGDAASLAAKVKAVAKRAEGAGDWDRADTYHQLAARAHLRANDAAANIASRIAGAETHVSHARAAADAGQHAAAAMQLERAIEAYRRIGGHRPRVDELHRELETAQRGSLRGFQKHERTVDISESVKLALDAVRNKPFPAAISALATLSVSPRIADLRMAAETNLRDSPLRFFIQASRVDAATGRTTGRRAPADLTDQSRLEAVVRTAMLEQACIIQDFVALGLEPARSTIYDEHQPSAVDFIPLVRSHPLVPAGHERAFAFGLAAGLRGDLCTSASLLIPQVENSLRHVLERGGGLVSALDDDGVQDVHDLGRVLYAEEMKALVQEDLLFDLQGLLVERFGSNLRYRVAHGLMQDHDFESTRVRYLWWLVLHMLVGFPHLFPPAGKSRAEEVTDPSPREGA